MTSKATLPPKLAPAAWSFHYAGPLQAQPNYSCVTCLAGKQGKCPAHGTSYAIRCAHCACAQGGQCHAHWGLDAAIKHYEGEICPPGAVPDFQQAISLARFDLELLDSGTYERGEITIDVSGSGASSLASTGRRSFAVEIVVR